MRIGLVGCVKQKALVAAPVAIPKLFTEPAPLVDAVRSNNTNGGNGSSSGLISETTPNSATSSFPTPTDAASSSLQPPTMPVVGAVTTTAATRPATVDACHHGGITYCVLNPAVTQSTIDQTICVSGWTATVRPPESNTESLKRKQIACSPST